MYHIIICGLKIQQCRQNTFQSDGVMPGILHPDTPGNGIRFLKSGIGKNDLQPRQRIRQSHLQRGSFRIILYIGCRQPFQWLLPCKNPMGLIGKFGNAGTVRVLRVKGRCAKIGVSKGRKLSRQNIPGSVLIFIIACAHGAAAPFKIIKILRGKGAV